MAEGVYNAGKVTLARVDLQAVDLRMILFSAWAAAGENPDLATVTALLGAPGVTEAAFTNYARQPLAAVAVAQNDVADRADVTANDVTFVNAGGAVNQTPAAAVIYHHVGADAVNIPISWHTTNFGLVATTGSNFVVRIASAAEIG
jgi:hypothetical protein